MDVDFGVEGIKLSLMNRKELVGEIAEEDGTGTIARELVGAGTADAEGGVGAFCMDECFTASIDVKRTMGGGPVMIRTLSFTLLQTFGQLGFGRGIRGASKS